MASENISLRTVDEMWKEIENFGIKREIFKRQNPTHEEVRDLYALVHKEKTRLKKV